jgi:hypothetical protein
MATCNNKVITDKNKVITDKNKVITDKNKVITDKNKVITDKNKVSTDKITNKNSDNSASFCLYQLVQYCYIDSSDSIQQIHNFKEKIKSSAKSYIVSTFVKNKSDSTYCTEITFIPEIVHPLKLIAKCSPDALKQLTTLTYLCDNKPIALISFDLLMITKLKKIDENTFCIDLSHLPHIPKYKHSTKKLNQIQMKIEYHDDIDISLELIVEELFLNMAQRLEVSTVLFFGLGISQLALDIPNKYHNLSVNINICELFPVMITKGFFIMNEKLDNIDRVNISFNCSVVRTYDTTLLMSICDIISENTIYVPFDALVKHDDMSPNTFINNVILHWTQDKIILTVRFKTKPEKSKVTICINGYSAFIKIPDPEIKDIILNKKECITDDKYIINHCCELEEKMKDSTVPQLNKIIW